ncbi:MAG: hypothetical protein LBG92_02140 [Prevotellaceae bacterium]|jgi:hypothetical protein|nr:hypothetical protein [Prevotellaceae bacterium]
MNFIVDKLFPFLLSQSKRNFVEKIFFRLAITCFIVDSILMAAAYLEIIPGWVYCRTGMPDPLSIIYTPFSILLLYEVYLLIFYLPYSITTYLGKQYEIITLILVRKLFYEIPLFSHPNLFNEEHITHLLVSLCGLIALCGLIFLFNKLSKKEKTPKPEQNKTDYVKFIAKKKILSVVLVLIFGFLFVKSFFEISEFSISGVEDIEHLIRQMSNSFFNDFFVVLILIEVLLLLFTFSFSDKFNKVVRNSGFIISTMLLKLSFRAEGNTTVYIMIIATLFGVGILWIYKLFEKKFGDSTE